MIASQSNERRRGAQRLVLGCGVVALVWGAVLPRLAEWPRVAEWIESNERQNVDPAAMYYTDLEGVRFLDLDWTPPHRGATSGETPNSPSNGILR